MSKAVVYTDDTGAFHVVSPKITPERTLGILVNAGLDARIVDVADLPPDRDFRDSWVDKGGRIEPDIQKCREIYRQWMRAARYGKLLALDQAFLRVLENGSAEEKAAIVAQKQALRDVTKDPRIDAARTLSELKAVWPDILRA